MVANRVVAALSEWFGFSGTYCSRDQQFGNRRVGFVSNRVRLFSRSHLVRSAYAEENSMGAVPVLGLRRLVRPVSPGLSRFDRLVRPSPLDAL